MKNNKENLESKETVEESSNDMPDKNETERSKLQEKMVWGLLSKFTIIIALLGTPSLFYEYVRIPLLNNKIEEKDIEIKKLNKTVTYLTNSSELIKVKEIYKELEEKYTLQQKIVSSQEKRISEKEQKIKELELYQKNQAHTVDKKIYDLNILNKKLEGESYKYLTNLEICKNNLDIKKEIDKLRGKIEGNNEEINRNDYFKPTEIQINTWHKDNERLHLMIQEYQKQLKCSSI